MLSSFNEPNRQQKAVFLYSGQRKVDIWPLRNPCKPFVTLNAYNVSLYQIHEKWQERPFYGSHHRKKTWLQVQRFLSNRQTYRHAYIYSWRLLKTLLHANLKFARKPITPRKMTWYLFHNLLCSPVIHQSRLSPWIFKAVLETQILQHTAHKRYNIIIVSLQPVAGKFEKRNPENPFTDEFKFN